MSKYDWDNNDTIEHHSEIKLKILESYIKEYFKTLCKHYNREEIKLTYVDGFAGGGVYKNKVLGSPLRVMDTIGRVKEEINKDRVKPIKFNIQFIFIDNDKQTIETLEENIKYLNFDEYKPIVICDEFENQVDNIILYISKHTPRANSAIMFLDPCGYTHISLSTLQKLSAIGGCEVIWNVMTDHIIHYVTNKNDYFDDSMVKIGLSKEDIDYLKKLILDLREDNIIILRHFICQYLHCLSNFGRASDFSVQQFSSNKFNTLLHLSRHPESREVMLNGHWNNASHSVTKYHNGIEYNLLYNTDKQAAFDFTEDSRKVMREQGIEKIYNEIKDDDIVPIEFLQDRMAQSYSALTKDDIKEIIKLNPKLIGFNRDGTPTKSAKQIRTVKRDNQINFYFPEN